MSRTIVIAIAVSLFGCGVTEEVGSGLRCGAGTHREGNECVPDDAVTSHRNKCEQACDISALPPNGCLPEDEAACMTECLSLTNGLSAECATCIAERSSIGPGVACVTSIECLIAGERCENMFCVPPDCSCDTTDSCEEACDCDPGCKCIWYVGRISDCDSFCR